jgi:hypothetical protein
VERGTMMTMLARKIIKNDSDPFGGADEDEGPKEVDIAKTRSCDLLDNHLIRVTACWRGMESDAPALVRMSITVDRDAHLQEQNHRIDTKDVGQAGGEMSTVLKVMETGGDIKPGSRTFKLRARREPVPRDTTATIFIQAAKTYPTQICVEDLGVIPDQL